ncbi:MAG: hypothetical protein ACK56I_34215, partial [bacterium]
MGYKIGTTGAEGLPASLRHKLLGACMDQNVSIWLLKACKHRTHDTSHEAASASHLAGHHRAHSSCEVEAPWFSSGFLDDWIYDTGATAHFTGHRSDYWDYSAIK